MNSNNEKMRKRLKRAAKKKAWRNNLHVFMRRALAAGFAAFLLSGSTLSSHLSMLVLLCCPRLPTPSLSCPLMPTLLSYPRSPTLLSSYFLVPALLFCPSIPALLFFLVPALLSLLVLVLAFCSVLDLALTWFTSSAFRIFKQALLDKLLGHQLTSLSPSKLFYPFLILRLLPKKSNCKWLFDIAFINSCPLATNHVTKEVDLSFGEYGCFVPVKLNRS